MISTDIHCVTATCTSNPSELADDNEKDTDSFGLRGALETMFRLASRFLLFLLFQNQPKSGAMLRTVSACRGCPSRR